MPDRLPDPGVVVPRADATRVVVVGMGAVGTHCAAAVMYEPTLRLVGLYDHDPDRADRTIADLVGGGAAEPPRITDDLDTALEHGADVAIVATSSNLDRAAPVMQRLLERGVSVLSSCEPLAWPWYRYAAWADRLDAAAKAHRCAILGTGINPGFATDTLAVTLASAVRRVKSVRCVRRVEASVRRGSLQARLGLGLTPGKFMDKAGRGEVGCAGLPEAVSMVAAGMGRRVEPGGVSEVIEPVTTDHPLPSVMGLIGTGEVAGVHQRVTWQGGALKVELDLTMAVGVSEPMDQVTIDGPVRLEMRLPGAVPGDSGTVAMLLNHIPVILAVPAGLHTMLSVPPAGCRGGQSAHEPHV